MYYKRKSQYFTVYQSDNYLFEVENIEDLQKKLNKYGLFLSIKQLKNIINNKRKTLKNIEIFKNLNAE